MKFKFKVNTFFLLTFTCKMQNENVNFGVSTSKTYLRLSFILLGIFVSLAVVARTENGKYLIYLNTNVKKPFGILIDQS